MRQNRKNASEPKLVVSGASAIVEPEATVAAGAVASAKSLFSGAPIKQTAKDGQEATAVAAATKNGSELGPAAAAVAAGVAAYVNTGDLKKALSAAADALQDAMKKQVKKEDGH